MNAIGDAIEPSRRSYSQAIVEPFLVAILRRSIAGSLADRLDIELPGGRVLRFGQPLARKDVLRLRIKRYDCISKIVRRGALGFAQAYIDNDIECSDLTSLFRIYLQNRSSFARAAWWLFSRWSRERRAHEARRNSKAGSRRNIAEHYDLGNDFFSLWLDEKMVYSSGLFARGAQNLDEAQAHKFKLIDDFVGGASHKSILEIGFGWGGLATQLASNEGTRVHGITLSREQLAHTQRLASRLSLDEKTSFRLQDYRDVRGKFDSVIAIEMIEAVGEAYWPIFFKAVSDRLKPSGNAVIQAITIRESSFDAYKQAPDFIQRYVFPGGMLPTKSLMQKHAGLAGLELDQQYSFGGCYAQTLAEWRTRFEASWPQIAMMGFDESFRRCWNYYLAYCEAGFLENVIDVGLYSFRKA